jgi:hypothetical protein
MINFHGTINSFSLITKLYNNNNNIIKHTTLVSVVILLDDKEHPQIFPIYIFTNFLFLFFNKKNNKKLS